MAIFRKNEAALAKTLKKLFAASDDTAVLAGLVKLEADCATLPMAARQNDSAAPPPLWCLVLGALAHRLLAMGRAADILPMLEQASDRFAPPRRHYAYGTHLGRLMWQAPFLSVPLILGALRTGEAEDAMMQVHVYVKHSDLGRRAWTHCSEVVGDLLRDDTLAQVARLDMGVDWLLDRQLDARSMLTAPDFSRERFVDFDETLLATAIAADRFADVEVIVDAHLAAGDRLESLPDTHLGFNAFCVLAALGRHDDALALAKRMMRQGYAQGWRFQDGAGKIHDWVRLMGQEKCMSGLIAMPAYIRFLESCVKSGTLSRGDPEQALLADVYDGVWSGKKPMQCKLTKTRIEPGGAVVRLRRLFDHHGVGDIEIAEAKAFRRSGWQSVRARFEANALPLAALFPGRVQQDRIAGSPKIAALWADIAQTPDALDLDRIVAAIAADVPPPRRFGWRVDANKGNCQPAFDPFAQDCGQSGVARLVWRLWKGGQMSGLLTSIATLPTAAADRLMVLIGCFDDAALRAAAARHFDLPDLPDMMALAFDSRQSLKQHRQMADFGRDNPRFRAGLVASMAADGLHLFSNYAPTIDWYLAGLTQFNLAKGSQLLWFLIHTPQDDPVLTQMLENRWLPTGTGSGGHDSYANAAHHYYRAAALHLAFNDADGFREWQKIDWMKAELTMAIDRKTLALLRQVHAA